MHLIIDIRSPLLCDSILTRYASNWVDLWRTRHPGDTISYIHFKYQECPKNGHSVVVHPPSWWGKGKSLSIQGTSEIFRCINFSPYIPYDKKVITISHIFDYGDSLYPRSESTWRDKFIWQYLKYGIGTSQKIVVPTLNTGQETVDILHTREEDIEIIPYITLSPGIIDKHILSQLSISGTYWLYDGSYGSEANILGLLEGYKTYHELGGSYRLILMGSMLSHELRTVSDLIQNMELTGLVRIIGSLEGSHTESLYMHASGWLYVGAYYTSGPRIELARSHHIPLLISRISSLEDYFDEAITIHPNHLKELGKSLQDLEKTKKKQRKKISNDVIIMGYEKIISEKR